MGWQDAPVVGADARQPVDRRRPAAGTSEIITLGGGQPQAAVPAAAAPGGWQSAPTVDRRAPAPKVDRAAADAAADAEKYRPDAGMSGTEKFLVGAGSTLDKAYRGVTSLFGKDNAEGADDAALYQKHRPEGWQTTAGEITGDIAAQAPLALVPGGALAQIGAAGLYGAATTPGDWKERATSGAVNAAGAAGGQLLTRAVGRLAKPVGTKADDILALEAKGVEPTFGQSMAAGKEYFGKAVGRAEEAAQSAPIAGGPLRRTRERAMDQWRQMTRDAALPPGAAKGVKTVDEVIDQTGKAYDAVLTKHQLPYASVTYQPDMRKLTAGLALDKEARAMVDDTFQQLRLSHMQNPTPGAQVSAVGAQQVESELKKKAFSFMNSQDPGQQEIGKAFKKLAEEYGSTWRNALPRDDLAAITRLDKGYGKRLALQKAALRTGAKASEGVPEHYGPVGLINAAKATDRIPGKRAYLKGVAPLQEEARLGMNLVPKVSDSGTTERAATLAFLAGLGEIGNLGTLGAASLYGTRPVQQWMTGRAMPKTQEAILRALRGAAPYGGAAGAGAAQYENQQVDPNAP
jgi:hypothetical protein